jgi:hypothetical protein
LLDSDRIAYCGNDHALIIAPKRRPNNQIGAAPHTHADKLGHAAGDVLDHTLHLAYLIMATDILGYQIGQGFDGKHHATGPVAGADGRSRQRIAARRAARGDADNVMHGGINVGESAAF